MNFSLCVTSKAWRFFSYIIIPQYYFEAITISRKLFLSGIIAILILSLFIEESLYVLSYAN